MSRCSSKKVFCRLVRKKVFFYKLIDGLESVLKASTSGLEIIFEIRIKRVF